MSDMTCMNIVLGALKVAQAMHMLYLSIACGAISMVITKSTLLNFFHDWLEKRAPKLEEMLSCPWCTSHWIALLLVLVYHPMLLTEFDRPAWQYNTLLNVALVPLDYLVNVMVMVFFASVASRVIYSAYKPVME